jgi:hypothetical protein
MENKSTYNVLKFKNKLRSQNTFRLFNYCNFNFEGDFFSV